MKLKNILWIFFTLLFFGGCEDLEDTYSDYAGDGAIRYVGRCLDVSVTSGWQRLIVKWTNNPDSRIKNIKVTWEYDGLRDSLILAAGTTECSIPGLTVGNNYEVKVYGVDEVGNQSLAIPLFGRPYTSNHEVVLSFTRLIAKHYFVKDRLALYFSSWSSDMESAELNYYSAGNLKTLKLDENLINKKYYLLPDKIDSDKPVILKRKGRVEGCDDLIEFDDYELDRMKLYTTDFKRFVQMKYWESDISDDFVNNREELEIDYTMTSFEDVLNFPNLKKLILGKNRFQKMDYLDEYSSDSKLYEKENSLFALDVAAEVCGLKVERYNKHFLSDDDTEAASIVTGESRSYIDGEMGNPTAPVLEYLKTDGWKITCSPEDEGRYDSYLKHLFDCKPETSWKPEAGKSARTHEILVDMKEVKTLCGVSIRQKDFDPKDEAMEADLLLSMVKVEISEDNITWSHATNMEENILGATAGEMTIFNFLTERRVRYLKFIINDQPYGNLFSVSLAEIGVF